MGLMIILPEKIKCGICRKYRKGPGGFSKMFGKHIDSCGVNGFVYLENKKILLLIKG